MPVHWFENDSFWDAVAPFLFSDARCKAAPGEVDCALALLDLQLGARVLDLCCGVGRHSLEFARRGFSVTGVDRTRPYLDRAQRDAREQGLTVEFACADMGEFRRPGAFDAAINMFTAFGYFETDDDELRVLSNILDSLKPNARVLIDVMGKEVIARNFQQRSWQATADGSRFFLEERQVRGGWAYIDNRWVIFDEAGRREFNFPIRVYSGRELEGLLSRAGFADVRLYGTLAGDPYDSAAQRLVAAARK